jgi:hypothetical protein
LATTDPDAPPRSHDTAAADPSAVLWCIIATTHDPEADQHQLQEARCRRYDVADEETDVVAGLDDNVHDQQAADQHRR